MKTILAVLILATAAIASPPDQFTVAGRIIAVKDRVITAEAQRVALADPPTVTGIVTISGHPYVAQAAPGMTISCVVRSSGGKYYFVRAK